VSSTGEELLSSESCSSHDSCWYIVDEWHGERLFC